MIIKDIQNTSLIFLICTKLVELSHVKWNSIHYQIPSLCHYSSYYVLYICYITLSVPIYCTGFPIQHTVPVISYNFYTKIIINIMS